MRPSTCSTARFPPGFSDRFQHHRALAYAKTHDNLLLTPHIGGSTIDAWRLTEAHAIEMAVNYLLRNADVKR